MIKVQLLVLFLVIEYLKGFFWRFLIYQLLIEISSVTIWFDFPITYSITSVISQQVSYKFRPTTMGFSRLTHHGCGLRVRKKLARCLDVGKPSLVEFQPKKHRKHGTSSSFVGSKNWVGMKIPPMCQGDQLVGVWPDWIKQRSRNEFQELQAHAEESLARNGVCVVVLLICWYMLILILYTYKIV